ncbi:MAG TPA: hypothetical protein VFZ97_18390 [Acidimicrobiales bacterium]
MGLSRADKCDTGMVVGRHRSLRLAAGRVLVGTTTMLMAGCSHGGRSGAGSPVVPSASCPALASAPRVDINENVIVGTWDQTATVRSLEQRLRLVGAGCPEARVGPAPDNGLPIPAGGGTLEIRWLKGVGDDPNQANAHAFYLLRDGDLALRRITGEPPGACTRNTSLADDRSPRDIVIAGKCTHLSSAFIDHIRPIKAAVARDRDPFTWTLTLTLDRATTRRVARAREPLFASIDGFPRGRAVLAGDVLTARGHYDGGGIEARADAVNTQVPIATIPFYFATS